MSSGYEGAQLTTYREMEPHQKRRYPNDKRSCSGFAPIAHAWPENLLTFHAIYQETKLKACL